MLSLTVLISCVVLCALTGALTFLRDPKNTINRLFSLLAFSAVAFAITNYLSLTASNRLLYMRLVTVFSTLAVTSLYYMIVFLSQPAKKLSSWQKAGVYVAGFVMLLDCTPLVFSGLSTTSTVPTPKPAPGAFLFIAQLFFYLLLGLILLAKGIKTSTGYKRQQFIYMLVGITPLLLGSPITGFVLAVLAGRANFVLLDSVYATFLAVLVGYSIVKHRLFDIRLVVARALGYTSSLAVLASIYGFVVFGVASYVFDVHLSAWARVFLSAATGVAALSFQRIKRFFDKGTNAIFYRDAYDVQELFDQLNKVLVSSLDIRYLMMQSISVIETALKPGFALVGLRDGDTGYRVFSSQKMGFSPEDIERVRRLTPHVHHKVIVADFIDDPKQQELKDRMLANGVAVLVRLTQDTRRNQEGLGYIVLGNKRSGNPYTNQDVQVLDTISSELIIAIQNALHYEEIQNFNRTLQAQVDEATRRLRRTNERLKELDETKDDFISMASHQLRTPLTSVKGYLSMVLEGDAGSITKTQRDMLGQAFFSSQRMVYLIADLLNVSRLKTGKFVIETTPVNLAELVEQEMSQLTETAAAKQLTLSFDKPKAFPTLMFDETKIRQVIMNFIDNAIYYTPSGGKIDVQLLDKPTAVELRVVDNGIGVPKREQPHLFTKFYRAGNARKARPDGTGLGLFMAKKVVTASGGALIFESTEGAGSTFGFTFSKSKLAVPSATPKPEITTAKVPIA